MPPVGGWLSKQLETDVFDTRKHAGRETLIGTKIQVGMQFQVETQEIDRRLEFDAVWYP